MEERRKLLLIDDDRDLCALMSDYFGQHGYTVATAADGRDGLARALQGGHDLVILDVMMPVIDGFEVLRQLRKRSAVPVIMLTARTAQPDRINGLNFGADDYLPKPFAPDELLARIRAVLRRTGKADNTDSGVVEIGGVQLDSLSRSVTASGEPVVVTAIEFDILECLMRSVGRVVSRDALAAVLYQRQATPYERAIDVHISHLRKKLERAEDAAIHTLRGSGYMFSPRSRTVSQA
jgi:two-component system response regulator CpxR